MKHTLTLSVRLRRHVWNRPRVLAAAYVLAMSGPFARRADALPADAPPGAPVGADPHAPAPQVTELIVLANGTGIAELDSTELRAVFRGERVQWPSDRRVTVILPSSRSDVAGAISRTMFRSSPGGMQRFWLALVFQGRAAPPVFVDSVEEMVSLVRRTPGAIALVPRDSVTVPGPLLVRVR